MLIHKTILRSIFLLWMKRVLLPLAFIFTIHVSSAQVGSFLALANNGQLYMVHIDTINGCTSKMLSLCNNVRPLSIGLDGSTLYINDNKANLYSTTLDANGSVGDCKLLGKFLSKSGSIWGLTVGLDGIIYAGSGSLIETYNIKTGIFGKLGELPANYSIGGDLMFYNGQLFEGCTNSNTGGSELVLVNLTNPSLSTEYLPFTSRSIFGIASITKRCSSNQSYALDQSGEIYKVDMVNRTQDPVLFCQLDFKINDAASIAEIITDAPPLPPPVQSPAIYCTNTASYPLKATITNLNDTLRWYTVPIDGVSSAAPSPLVGNTPSSTTYYVSLFDTATKCEGERVPLVVNVETVVTPFISIANSKADFCSGQYYSFIASNNIASTNPTIQWKLNGQNVGINADTFSTGNLSNNDKISCVLNTNLVCATNPATTSNQISIASIATSYTSIAIMADTTTICSGDKVTFTSIIKNGGTLPTFSWFKNGISLNNSNSNKITIDSLKDGDQVSCLLTSNIPCLPINTATSLPISIKVNTAPILPAITGSTSTCQGQSIRLVNTNTGGVWNSSVPTIATVDASSGLVKGISAGNALISYAKTNVCGTTTITYPITVSSNLIGELVGANILCKGDTALFSNSKGIAGKWESGNATIATVTNVGMVVALDTGSTQIKYNIRNACGTNTLTSALKVTGKKPFQVPYAKHEPTCIKPFSGEIDLDVIGAEKPYKVLFNKDTLLIPASITKLGEGNYPLYIYNSSSCLVDSLTNISLKMPNDANCYVLHVPTAFAPNSAIGNNLLKPIGGSSTDINAVVFRVYNRFGNKVFESHELYNGWDGKMNGVLQDAGTYIWYLEYKVNTTNKITQQGASVLIR